MPLMARAHMNVRFAVLFTAFICISLSGVAENFLLHSVKLFWVPAKVTGVLQNGLISKVSNSTAKYLELRHFTSSTNLSDVRLVSPTSSSMTTNVSQLQRKKLYHTNLSSILASMPDGDILFSYGNSDHLPFQLHWICNTAGWPGVHERTLLVTTDKTSEAKIYRLNRRVKTFVVPASVRTHGFYSKGYRRLTIQRIAILVDVLKSGRGVIMFEGDAVWTRNVLEDRNLTDPNRIHDIAVYRDGPNGENIGAGFMSMKGNRSAALTMWQRVLDRLNENMQPYEKMPDSTLIPNSRVEHEQAILTTNVLPAMLRRGEMQVLNLNRCLYASGLWYKFKSKYVTMCGTSKPIVLNNNYIIGNQKKIDRARRHNHWFLEGERCRDWKTTLAAVDGTFK